MVGLQRPIHIFKLTPSTEYKLMKIAFRKGYDKGDIRNFLANSNEDIEKFLKTLPQKFYKPVINSKMFDSSEIIPDPKDFNPKRKSYLFLMIS